MLRGHLGSVELIRSIFNPSWRRNLSAASIRYAEDKERKKADGVFSWLKDFFKSEDGIQETRNTTIDRGPVTVFDYPEINQARVNNFKLGQVDQGSIEDPTNYRNNLLNPDFLNSEQHPKNSHVNYDQRQHFPGHNLLALPERIDTSIRSIMGCTPRNTKPPIREPNMPEKQEKKDEKKEKKKKKPVIRMEGGPNEPGDTIHDNLDVNFRQQWGVKLPEEVQKSAEAKPAGSTFQAPASEMKSSQVTMSSSKDSNQLQEQAKGAAPNDPKQDATTLKQVANASATMISDNRVFDQDYNVPPGTGFDAEVSAWKELVLRSKVPPDPSKENFIPDDGRQAEMLSIRPEPPRPKLDVQAVPTSTDPSMHEEDDEADFSPDTRTNLKKESSSSADIQKLDSKKLHTGPARFSRKGVELLGGTTGTRGSSGILNGVASQRAFDFSTSTDGSWESVGQASAKETERREPGNRLDKKSSNIEVPDNLPGNQMISVDNQQERLANFEQQKQADLEQDSTDSLNRIAEREIEISLNRSREEDQDIKDDRMITMDRQDQKSMEDDRQLHSRSDNFQQSFDYANIPYEDDFYPGYESMTLEPTAERSTTERSRESQRETVASTSIRNDEVIVSSAEDMESREEEYVSDGNYIRLPGDPYPYSREHFYKWHVHDEDYDIQDTMNPHYAGSAPTGAMQTASNLEKLKKAIRKEDDSAIHVETIQPDVHLSSQGVNTNSLQRQMKNKPSSLIQKPKDTTFDAIQKIKDIHALRSEQLSLVKKDEIEKIYESKNYAYLRAEEMKNFQLTLKPKPRADEQDTSV